MNNNDDKLHFPESPSRLNGADFVQRFGAVYEHSPWLAQQTWQQGLGAEHDTVAGLAQAFAQILAQAGYEQQLTLIRAHPDLAGRAAVRGDLTEDSNEEQSSAGLDQCTAEEFERFQRLNNFYKSKFNFPFIMAVRGSNRHQILAAFEQRINNDPDSEFQLALTEINKIARLRLWVLAQQQD